MRIIPVENFNFPEFDDYDVINAWHWFMSFISIEDWENRKAKIESKITVEFRTTEPFSEPLNEGTLLVIKDDVIGWYLYLVDMLINEPHKYEHFQGARIVPIFKRFGMDLHLLKNINGIEKKVRALIKKRPLEADAVFFEFTTALLWARNGYDVTLLEESNIGTTPDILAIKEGETFYIECKRQSKTAEYTYEETLKRQKMTSYISKSLIMKNILLDIVFHVELKTLPDTFLRDLLRNELDKPVVGKIVQNEQVDIDLSFVDIISIKEHLKKYNVKYNSPMLNKLIGKKAVDNNGFTCGIYADFFRMGTGEVNNLYIQNIERAFGVYWHCDSKDAISAKARGVGSQINSAMKQFNDNTTSVIHIGIDTYDGPEIEKRRFEKIKKTIENINPEETSVKWIFCNFFQAYSPPDQYWVFDETVSTISPFTNPISPIELQLMIVPSDMYSSDYLNHWDRPLP